jgi:hypothetical protein
MNANCRRATRLGHSCSARLPGGVDLPDDALSGCCPPGCLPWAEGVIVLECLVVRHAWRRRCWWRHGGLWRDQIWLSWCAPTRSSVAGTLRSPPFSPALCDTCLMKCFCVSVLAACNAHIHQARGNIMAQGDVKSGAIKCVEFLWQGWCDH